MVTNESLKNNKRTKITITLNEINKKYPLTLNMYYNECLTYYLQYIQMPNFNIIFFQLPNHYFFNNFKIEKNKDLNALNRKILFHIT